MSPALVCRTGTKFPNEQVRSMIGIVLVTHGRLAAEFRAALEHVVGPQKQIESIAIGPDDDIEQRRQDIVSAVTKVDSGAGVVVLTDMFGGTPSNLAISIMNGSNIEVIAAVNLPMLIKLASVRETSSLEQAVIQAQDAGRKYIYVASRVLGAKPNRTGLRQAVRKGRGPWSIRQPFCSGVLVSTNRMFALVTASQFASASAASFSCSNTKYLQRPAPSYLSKNAPSLQGIGPADVA
jgi:mannose PTS system EIIA component